jgi:hypothetical protein
MITGTKKGRLFWWPRPVAAAPTSHGANGHGTCMCSFLAVYFWSVATNNLDVICQRAKPLPLIPSPAAVENVARKSKRTRTSASLLIRRVSSIFTPRKKPHPDLKLVNQALRRDARRPSYSSFTDSPASDDDIRIPSGLGSAVSILLEADK